MGGQEQATGSWTDGEDDYEDLPVMTFDEAVAWAKAQARVAV